MANFAFKEEKTPNKFSLKSFFKVAKYLKDAWFYLLMVFLTFALISFCDSSFTPMMNASMLASLRNYSGGELIIHVKLIFSIEFDVNYWIFAIIFIAEVICRSLLIFVNFYFNSKCEIHLSNALRHEAFKRVQELSFSYFDKTPKGWLIARLQSDCSDISEVVSYVMTDCVWVAFDLAFSLASMFSLSWKLSLVILATTPVIIIVIPLIHKLMLKLSRIARNAYSNFVRWLAEAISGSQTIKTIGIEDEVQKEAEEVSEDIRKKRFKSQLPGSAAHIVISLMSAVTSSLIIVLGHYVFNLTASEETIYLLTVFIGFVSSIYNPISNLTENVSQLMTAQASAEKVVQLIETKPQIQDSDEVIKKYGTLFDNKQENFEEMQGDITFENINFSYENSNEVIHNLNLNIKQGETVAIVGETGSGKTTTVNLLCRFYEPTSGRILIDGVDYQKRSVGWLRSNIGYVQQNPFVFNATFKDNIRYGKLDASDEEIIKAAKIVGIHDFIMAQSDGYDTKLEDGGNQLSLGQKQLISFARAIIRNPKIMILDEATSSIDTHTELQIQNAMKKVLNNRTSIMIAHRLSTIVDADRIIVMSEGKIIEEGSHVQLMEAKGYYYRLYMNQFKDLNIDNQIQQYNQQIKDKHIKL